MIWFMCAAGVAAVVSGWLALRPRRQSMPPPVSERWLRSEEYRRGGRGHE